jgi:tetratricopeptide (TPR) repeat protein
MSNLATLYSHQRRYDDAEDLFRRALTVFETAFGSDHGNIAVTVNSLANLFWLQDRRDEAKPLYERALRLHEKVHGPDHPRTVTCRQRLAEARADSAGKDPA